jgi:hypothetical protein
VCGLLGILDIGLMLLLVGVTEEEVVPISAGGCILGALIEVRLVEQEELPIPTSDCTLGFLAVVRLVEQEELPIPTSDCTLGFLAVVRLVEQEELPIPTSDCTLGWGICLIESDGYAIVPTQLCGEIVERGISLLGIGDRDSIVFSIMDGGLEIASSTSITDVVENACSGCVASVLSGEEGGELRGCGCCAVFFA